MSSEGKKLWLWRDGEGKYVAFDDLFPTLPGGGDPAVLGQPCGYATLCVLTLEEAQRISAKERSNRASMTKGSALP